MLDVCLLGTGGTVPLPNRWLTSCYIRCAGETVLIDCGEGTQIAINEQKFSCKQINTIVLTHCHADHTAGLPGLLLTMAKSDRMEPVDIYGPKGIHELISGVHQIARYIPFELHIHELAGKEDTFNIGEMKFTAFSLRHSVPCMGYRIDVMRTRRFDKDKAIANDVPVRLWSFLQKGETKEMDGKEYTPEMVLGEERRGISLVYATDTRPCESLIVHAQDADLMIAEGMYGDPEKQEKADKNRHMMMYECAEIAKKANVRELWFTHYSPSMHEPGIYLEQMQEIFAGCLIPEDGQKKDLVYSDQEERK